MSDCRHWPAAQVYRSGLYNLGHELPFKFYSLYQPDKAFSTEQGFFNLVRGNPDCLLPGQSNRFGYPKDFIGPLPCLCLLQKISRR